MSGFIPTKLFPNPYCCLCFEDLHKGHKGWDVCAQCHKHELMYVEVYRDDLDEYDCNCYEKGSEMQNVEVSREGNFLILKIDTTKRFGKSASGKNTIIAKTEGNVTLEGGVTVGLNVYCKE